MLGDLLGEEQGQVTGMRVLPSEGQAPKVEVTFQAGGKLLGLDVTDMGTYHSVLRPNGTLFAEGQGVTMTADGDAATWIGQGVGRFTGRGTAQSWRGAIYYQTASSKLARLNGAAVLFEHEVDENGRASARLWEWK